MRLTTLEITTILTSIKKYDSNACVYLFGSRVDEQRLGGDIDILVHSQVIDKFMLRKIKWHLIEQLGEQKIDILLSKNLQEPFVCLVFSDAIKL